MGFHNRLPDFCVDFTSLKRKRFQSAHVVRKYTIKLLEKIYFYPILNINQIFY